MSHVAGKLKERTVDALGITFPDIGTSPIYAFTLALLAMNATMLTVQNVIGAVSFLIWVMLIVVTYWFMGRYLTFHDELGRNGPAAKVRQTTMAIAQLYKQHKPKMIALSALSIFLAVINMSLFGDDVIITPGIGILSSFEGFATIDALGWLNQEAFAGLSWVTVLSATSVAAMYLMQFYGTEKIAKITGPIMGGFMVLLLIFGANQLLKLGINDPIWQALNPLNAVRFVIDNVLTSAALTSVGLIVIGELSLCSTGGEAGPWDQEFFGGDAIRLGWAIVLIASATTYLAQGSYTLQNLGDIQAHKLIAEAEGHHYMTIPIFEMVSEGIRPFFIAYAAVASWFAGQAVISAIFAMYRQLVQMGWMGGERFIRVREKYGHQFVFVSHLCLILMPASVFTVLFFRTSEAMGSIYGVTVTLGFLFGLLQGILMLRVVFHNKLWVAFAQVLPVLSIVSLLFRANVEKLTHNPAGAAFTGIAASAWALAITGFLVGLWIVYGKSPADFRPIHEFTKQRRAAQPLQQSYKGVVPVFANPENEDTPAAGE